MTSAGNPSDTARQLQQVAAELEQVAGRLRSVGTQVEHSLGSSATGADRRMLAGLGQASRSTQGAQQALSAAASSLRRIPVKRSAP